MKYCLITPLARSRWSNPGWHFITAGIRYLVRQADPAAEFHAVSMFDWSPATAEVARYSDVLVLCGNPRFDFGEPGWLYNGLLDAMAATGRPILDAWGGAGVMLGTPAGRDAAQLAAHERNANIGLYLVGGAAIARDTRARAVYERLGVRVWQMPCSSYWAAAELGVEGAPVRELEAVVGIARPNNSAHEQDLRELARSRLMIATCLPDWTWLSARGMPAELLHEPGVLLRRLAQCRSVVSYRLHAAIPAASVGAEVYCVAIDTRAEACAPFGIPYGPAPGVPKKATAPAAPDIGEILCYLQSK